MSEEQLSSIWNHFIGPKEIKQTYYHAGDIRTRAIECGEGEPLIFLHGTGGHAESFARNILAHAEHFHVYSIDMVGHGFSDKPMDIDYDMLDFVAHLKDFVDEIGASRVNLSGESLGGQVAVYFAREYPQLVNRMVLNTGIPGPRTEQGKADLRDLVQRTKNAADTLSRETIRQRVDWLMYDEADVTDELVENRYYIYSRPGAMEAIRYMTVQVLEALIDFEEGDNEFLRDIEHETLVFWTDHNPGFTAEEAREAASKMPNHRVYVMEDAAHWPQWEHADEFNRVHLDFLRHGL